MNSKIRQIVLDARTCFCGPSADRIESLIRELEAYHDAAVTDAAAGALAARDALDRALGRDAGEPLDERARR